MYCKDLLADLADILSVYLNQILRYKKDDIGGE